MYTNPHFYDSGQTVNASRLNSDARDNVNAIYNLATNTESLLNPLVSGIIGYSSDLALDTVGTYTTGQFVGCVGLEKTADRTFNVRRQWRVSIAYTMATNSVSGTTVQLNARRIGWMGRPYSTDSNPYSTQIYSGPTVTSLGKKFHVSSWQTMASMDDEIWEIYVSGVSNDYPFATFSNLHVCFQVRDY